MGFARDFWELLTSARWALGAARTTCGMTVDCIACRRCEDACGCWSDIFQKIRVQIACLRHGSMCGPTNVPGLHGRLAAR